MTDNEIIEALKRSQDVVIIHFCDAIKGEVHNIHLHEIVDLIEKQEGKFGERKYTALDVEANIAKYKQKLDEARRDCAVAERNHANAVQDFKKALLKKIFPYDAADKKQYSINAYAVEKAIIEVAEQTLYATHREGDS
jgi:hypothetical protein